MSATAEEVNELIKNRSQEESETDASVEEVNNLITQMPGATPPAGQQAPMEDTVFERAKEEAAFIGKNIASGMMELVGLPGTLAGIEPLSGKGLREALAGEGDETALAFRQEDEPDTFEARFLRNMGMIGPTGIGAGAYKSLLRATAVETGAAAGAAGGGKFGEDMFPQNPLVGRAVGEIVGGLGGGFVGSGGGIGIVAKGVSKVTEPFSAVGGKRRATQRVGRAAEDPAASREALKETQDIADEVPELTPAQRVNDPFMAQLEAAVRNENPTARTLLANRTAESSRKLKEIAERTGDVEDVRNYLNTRMNLAVARSAKSAGKVRGGAGRPEVSSQNARRELERVYEIAREQEKSAWNALPTDVMVKPSNSKTAWKEELEDLTVGDDLTEIPAILKKKLGTLADGELKGGELGNKTTAKALHRFYSVLGRQMSREAGKEAPNANKLRILKKVRSNVLEDLEQADVGEDYKQAIALSRDINQKFTQGNVGQLLGYSKSGGPTNATETLEALMGHSGEKKRTAVKEFLDAAPEAKKSLEEFIRSQFVHAAFNSQNNRIATTNATKFLKDYRPVLREFPDLRMELTEAARDQRNVDDLLGVSDFYEFSPAMRQKKSAGVFLQAPPGKEIERVINATSGKPKSTTAAFQELVREVKQDETGRAVKGLKRSFAEHLMTPSSVEDVEGQLLINGKQMMKNINSLEGAAVRSGMMTPREMSRLRKIARLFEGIQKTETARAAPEGIIGDTADMVVNAVARVLGARFSQMTPSGGAGVGLQEAQLGSGIMRRLADRMTVRGAKNLLTDAVQDPKVMDDLFANLSDKGIKEREAIVERLMARLPQGATRPAAVTGAQEIDKER